MLSSRSVPMSGAARVEEDAVDAVGAAAGLRREPVSCRWSVRLVSSSRAIFCLLLDIRRAKVVWSCNSDSSSATGGRKGGGGKQKDKVKVRQMIQILAKEMNGITPDDVQSRGNVQLTPRAGIHKAVLEVGILLHQLRALSPGHVGLRLGLGQK